MFDPLSLGTEFSREHGTTEAEWLQQLPGAVRDHALTLGPGEAWVAIGSGTLHLQWDVLPPRQIALMRMPRLLVRYRFSDVPDEPRARFLRYFFLFIQKGGG